MDVSDKIQALVHQAAIVSLSHDYASAVDQFDNARFLSLFSDDAIFVGHNGFRYSGRDKISAIVPGLKELFVSTWHAVHQVNVKISGDHATGETYCTARYISRSESRESEVTTMTIRYRDELVRFAEGWRFRCRRQCQTWMEIGPISVFRK